MTISYKNLIKLINNEKIPFSDVAVAQNFLQLRASL